MRPIAYETAIRRDRRPGVAGDGRKCPSVGPPRGSWLRSHTIVDPPHGDPEPVGRSARKTGAVLQENVVDPRRSKKLGSAGASLRPMSTFPQVAKHARNREQGRLIQVKAKQCPGM